MRAWLPILGLGLLAGCAAAPVEVRQFENLGALRQVVIYDDGAAVSRDCLKRTGGIDDGGKTFSRTNACTDSVKGVVRIASDATLRDFLHELCHLENPAARAFCSRVFPGGR